MRRQQLVIELKQGLSHDEIKQSYLDIRAAAYETIGDKVHSVFGQVEPDPQPLPLEIGVSVSHGFQMISNYQAYCLCGGWRSTEIEGWEITTTDVSLLDALQGQFRDHLDSDG